MCTRSLSGTSLHCGTIVLDMEKRGTARSPNLIRPYMPELDVVRGIAILLVVCNHGLARPLHADIPRVARLLFVVSSYGGGGVNLFFVLSGLLITGILLDSRNQPGYFRQFYLRRALRILPALYGTLLVLLVGGRISLQFLAVSALFLANFASLFGVGLQYGPLWSLAVEEHFYLIWPLIVRFCRMRQIAVLAAAICVFSPILRSMLVDGTAQDALISLQTWYNLDGISTGALLALWLRAPTFRRQQLARIAPVMLLAGLIATALLRDHARAETALISTSFNLASVGLLTCLMLLATSHWEKFVNRPLLKFFGFISYGLYLVHILAFRIIDLTLSRWFADAIAHGWPMTATFCRFFIGATLATTIAFLSRRSLETWFLRLAPSSRQEPTKC